MNSVDAFGNDVTLENTSALESWNATMLAFLAHSAKTPEHLAATLAKAPRFAMGHATKGMFYLLLGRAELFQTAKEALDAAQASLIAQPPTKRETLYVKALEAYYHGRPKAAVAAIEQILLTHPQDALAAKLCHALRFVLGDCKGMRRSIERVLPAYDQSHAAQGYLRGCHAFALEETGDYRAAEAEGRKGLETAADDAWGLHAVAHVYDMTSNAQGGVDWLTGREAAWAHCNNFRYHVWWHKALMHLELGDIDQVLALYDKEIRKDRTDDYRDISNATSLLSRLELEGVPVGNRWDELADLSENRTEDGCLIFADLHYLLALVGSNRNDAVRAMIGRMHQNAINPKNEIQALMANPGVSAATGLEAFGECDFRAAYINLAHARASMQKIGGSHAQRDVFERLTIDAAIRSGFLDEAEMILNERKDKRAGTEDTYTAVRMSLISQGRSDSAVAKFASAS